MPRSSDTAVAPLFLERWSPRAYDGSPIAQADLDTILEAGRWAPSAYNYQPWRFLYAHRDTPDFARFLDLLVPFNQGWADKASVLIFFVSETTMGAPEKPSHSHSFDTGAAWGQIGLQAAMLGYHAHGMTGIALDRIPAELGIPDGFRVEAAAAIGRMGDPASLPEGLREKEVPSDRKPLADMAFAGNFPA